MEVFQVGMDCMCITPPQVVVAQSHAWTQGLQDSFFSNVEDFER